MRRMDDLPLSGIVNSASIPIPDLNSSNIAKCHLVSLKVLDLQQAKRIAM